MILQLQAVGDEGFKTQLEHLTSWTGLAVEDEVWLCGKVQQKLLICLFQGWTWQQALALGQT